MASNKTANFPSFHSGYHLDREEDGSNADTAVPAYLSPQLACDEEHAPRTDTDYDEGTTDEEGGGGGSSGGEALASPVTERSRVRRSGRAACREAMVERAWEMRRSESPVGASGCRLLVRPARGRSSKRWMCMDTEEVKACRDLGLELPRDWTYEISAVDRPRSAGNSPDRRWMRSISQPGGDPRDVKSKLKVWAHAVAAASASRLSS